MQFGVDWFLWGDKWSGVEWVRGTDAISLGQIWLGLQTITTFSYRARQRHGGEARHDYEEEKNGHSFDDTTER